MKLPQLPETYWLKPIVVRRVVGNSMAPSLLPGTVTVAARFPRLQTGRVVIFVHKGIEKIKRIQQIDARYVYVVGDNPTGSTDSRDFGWIDKRCVIGTVVWPRIPKVQ